MYDRGADLEVHFRESRAVNRFFRISAGVLAIAATTSTAREIINGSFDWGDGMFAAAAVLGIASIMPAIRESRLQMEHAETELNLVSGQQGSNTVE